MEYYYYQIEQYANLAVLTQNYVVCFSSERYSFGFYDLTFVC
jgi:hypothetical protein